MATYQEYKSRSNGNAYDIDGSFGAQCWDGYADYCRFLGVPYANCTNTGYARDIWEQRHENGILNYFDEVEVMQAGDVAIFMVVAGVTPYSHVAIFDSDAGSGYGWFLGQNQGGANGAYNLVKIPYSATYPTAFRPKVFKNAVTVTGNIGLNKGDYFIDVSAYQQADLTATCRQAGTTKTIIKVSESLAWLSDRHQQQANTSDPIGYYHFGRFGGDSSLAQREADLFLSNLPSKKVSYLVIDYEDSASADKQANTNAVIAFMDKITSAGYKPVYYSYKPFTLNNVDYQQIIAKYPNSIWIAGYPDYEVRSEPLWDYFPSMDGVRWWQFTSVGIAGGLDKNIVLLADDSSKVDIPKIDKPQAPQSQLTFNQKLDTNTKLDNSNVPYYEATLSTDYYVESKPNASSADKEFIKAGTRVRVYEKVNGWSRINASQSDQWVEDKYLANATQV
ncbi:glycosyl hydrolase family 25 [Streptococcus agalactiae ATCC 13813]|uniref:Phage lysin, N-acetylmuramoyl-L-alanine amidase n=2 Tax=Streptococcus agalactiae TaxID=1311 RepID=A0A7Z7K9X4_STRAG|nr:GH25 family lysozyme [Streptococcus agalactiae]EFV98141.1 glycosyl hydrolase family 25 [Streptococcus agalactiae ATCC 13813]PHU31520.1 lysin [Streptococcus agalactiae]PHU32609.1 lysin [Streptococcus agalactiae]PHU33410.1 lysin [Streptococcus agalactiae]SQA19279.1 Phage lysin, N-acetylmuramoyl-L-alanine amidase [Streptococcus agalactiae]